MHNEIKSLFCDIFNMPEQEVVDTLAIGQTPKWDSLGHMQLIAAIEKCYGFELSFDEIVAMRTFRDVCNVVKAKNNTA